MVAKRRLYDDRARDVALAWRMANYSRADKLPELRSILAELEAHAFKQTVAQQRQVMLGLSARYGIPIKRVRLIRREVN